MDWLINLFRTLCFGIDQIIYGFISTVYNLFYDITNFNIFAGEFGESIFNNISQKIYALLGIFMLFKVTFSIFTYIINPDEFSDKSKGFNKLISNIIVTLIFLVFTPLVFKQAMDLQQLVLKNNVIGNIFAGDKTSSYPVDPGRSMAYQTLVAFYHLNNEDCLTDPNDWSTNGCETQLKSDLKNDDVKYLKLKETIEAGYVFQDVWGYMNMDVMGFEDQNNNRIINYTPIISTIAGGAVCLLLMVFCFDVAVRNIKLAFLQMLAPVPIISRIDPKKGKEVFDKWIKECISTYLDLFIRLLAIDFAIFIIGILSDRFPGESSSFMVRVFIIFGTLLFAKQLPEFIKKLTGFDSKGSFTFSPIKKFNETGVPSLMAAGAGGILGATANFQNSKAKGFGGKALSAIGGFSSGTYNTLKEAIKNKGMKNIASIQAGVSHSSNNRRLHEGGYNPLSKLQDVWTDMSGYKFNTGTSSMLKNELYEKQMEVDNNKQNEEAARRSYFDYINDKSSSYKQFFDFETKMEENGKFKYVEKNYDDFKKTFLYGENGEIQKEISRISKKFPDHEWTQEEKDFVTKRVENEFNSKFQSEFETIREQYKAVGELDLKTRASQKDLKDIQEQIDNSKGKK